MVTILSYCTRFPHNRLNPLQFAYPYPLCKYILSHPHSGRLHRIFVTPVAPSKTQNDQQHLQSKWLKLFCGCPKFLPRLNLPHHPISAIPREAMPHFYEPRGNLLSLKMTKNAPKLNVIASSTNGWNPLADALNSFPHPICHFIQSYPFARRAIRTNLS